MIFKIYRLNYNIIMIQHIRTSKISKAIASYLALQLIITTIQPSRLFALTSGPSQPEFNAFTPIGTSDMVNLSSGDFNYNIPIMDVGGYPLNLSYQSGISMDQEASWVGLGWNLNVGQINRQVRGIPDDFKGDEIKYEKNLKKHVTVGINTNVDFQIFGAELPDNVKNPIGGLSIGLGVKHSNYHGVSFTPSYGLSFDLSDNVTVGMNVQTSATEGVSVNPRVSAKGNLAIIDQLAINGNLNAGLSYNSSRGLGTFNLQSSLSTVFSKKKGENEEKGEVSIGGHGSLSFSDPFTITPRKRSAFIDKNSTFSFSLGPTAWGFDVETELSATASTQELKDKEKTENAYGYEYTGQASAGDVLDYNRENDRLISKNLLALPVSNYTYDLYSVQGQGISGMFRPHRSKIGQIYDEVVQDESQSVSLGAEFEGGAGWHVGANLVNAPSNSHTGVWQTQASNSFKNDNENTVNQDYEAVYFKYVGEHKIDKERELYTSQLHRNKAMAIKLGGGAFNRYASNQFRVKDYDPTNNAPSYSTHNFSGAFKRAERDLRNQSIQKISKEELPNFYGNDNTANTYAENHHTAEMRVLNRDGATYVFGETAYNVEKREVSFATDATNGDCQSGLVEYRTGENSKDNSAGIDDFYDKVTTPAYAHTYLLSSILSSDYEDMTGNGPTADDLGAYTKFEYFTPENELYRWRIPYEKNHASYNAGLNTNKDDQKGSYVYGTKEVKYVKTISTKTHTAVFKLSKREDSRGAEDENGGLPISSSSQYLYKIDKIELYSKPEYDKYTLLLANDNPDDDPSPEDFSPIKTAYFEYDYSLCENTPSSMAQHGGKLTLKKVYFTYRTSEMGRYTPYTFEYEKDFNGDGIISDQESYDSNPDYSLKAFDIWGNYKPNQGGCGANDELTNQEFPFVDQQDRATQDINVSAWTLRSIGLPSGGDIDITYESDDYQYVQDKHTMQMFKVVGAGEDPNPNTPKENNKLYKSNAFTGDAKYLYVQLPDETDAILSQGTDYAVAQFKEKYLKNQEGKPIYFRFLLNMTKAGVNPSNTTDYDYVTGYFNMDIDPTVFKASDGGIYAGIPMQTTDMEGGINGERQVNPISKAGWYFGRSYLNGIVYDLNQNAESENIRSIARSLISSIANVTEIFTGPNARLRKNRYLCAQVFKPEKSWIRLSTPKTYKLGGGLRVKAIEMSDNWNTMVSGDQLQTYGQTYNYTLEDGSTSGVATFEPNDSAENPFVEPFYDNGERLIAPREVSYIEKPFGKAFFPAATVTYSKVTVQNLQREGITRHATGKVVSEFYTSKDFPTKIDYTDVENHYDSNENNVLSNLLGGIIGLPIHVKKEFTLSQGYVIQTNDMNGKSKSQKVYQEAAEEPISSVFYNYNTVSNDVGTLSNKVKVIDTNGEVSTKEIAVDYDVITDFRESYSNSRTVGVNANVAAIPVPFIPPIWIVPTIFPSSTRHENTAHSVITTKVIHTTAIMKEKIATDLGSRVSTLNEAWDANTGEVLLTKTQNEFDDAYYNFNFPAYWGYKNMGQASKNLGLRGVLSYAGGYFTYTNADEFFTLGDEIIATYGNAITKRLWVVDFNANGNGITLMDREGSIFNNDDTNSIDFKIVRSGYRNMQMANMGAITMMENPIQEISEGNYSPITANTFAQSVNDSSKHIINASAVSYNDFWNCQCENELPSLPYEDPLSDVIANTPIENYGFNPYVYNAHGEWRADKSYAYLAERTDAKQGSNTLKENTRKEGYFKAFDPYYSYNGNYWVAPTQGNNNWTFASEVTQYSPFGAELENRDALGRHSAAQYGYNFTLPTAVVSNSRYRHMGSDNFEDYEFLNTDEAHFSYKEIVEQDGEGGIETSTDQAHTGSVSLLVDQQNAASLPKELIAFVAEDPDTDGDGINDIDDNCPNTANTNQYDYDGDGIGAACDDELAPIIIEPTIENGGLSGQFRWWRRQAKFQIEGPPNSLVKLKLFNTNRGHHGWRACFNGGNIFYDNGSTPYEFEVQLDATGKSEATLEMQVNAPDKPRKRKKHNHTIVDLYIYHLNDDIPNTLSPSIRLHVVGFKKPGSGNWGPGPIFNSKL